MALGFQTHLSIPLIEVRYQCHDWTSFSKSATANRHIKQKDIFVSKPVVLGTLAAALARGTEVKTTLIGNDMSDTGAGDVQPESESVLCKETL